MSEIIKDMIIRLEKSSEFRDWKKDHPDYRLAHVFKMLDEPNKDAWQVGYFNPHNDSITTFVVGPERVDLGSDEKAFKKPGSHILGLELDKVNISFAQALDDAEERRKKEYPRELPAKTFFILQNLPDFGNVFNITFFTMSFKTVNIKVSSDDGKIVFHDLISVFEMTAGDRKKSRPAK